MTAKVEALGTGFSETTGKIDTSSITVKDAIKGVRDVLYDLSMTSSDYAGTYQGILSSFNNTSGSAATAQEAFDMVYNSLKDAGVPLDELNQALAERFPSATVAVRNSVSKNIVGAQETVSTATGKMKTDAEANLADVQKAAEDTAETAQEWYSQLCVAVTKAKQEYAVALADEAIAQEIYDSFLKEQETSEEESSSSEESSEEETSPEESSEEQTSPSISQESQAQTQTQSQTPSSSREESQIKDVVLGIEDYSMLFGLGLAGAGGMLLIWLALKFKRS